MAISSIQWTDYSFNPWLGCRKVAPECANCYAETLDRNRYAKTLAPGTKAAPVSHWGSGPRHRTKTWGDPIKWNRIGLICPSCGGPWDVDTCARCAGSPHRPRVFCASLADWLDDENVPVEWFADLLKLIFDTPDLDWLLLTKRPQNWKARLTGVIDRLNADNKDEETKFAFWVWGWLKEDKPPANIWIGVSAGADQAAALDIPARIHFLSCEPMLRPLQCTDGRCPDCGYTKEDARNLMDHRLCKGPGPKGFDWIIFGGESGSKARPCNIDWISEGVKFCRAHGIAPFVKQLGSRPFVHPPTSQTYSDGSFPRTIIKDSHGGDMAEWPEDLRVREFPTVNR